MIIGPYSLTPRNGTSQFTLTPLTPDPMFLLSAGNKFTLETRPQQLGIDVREELLQFHSKYYSSNVMALVVLGKGQSDPVSVALPVRGRVCPPLLQ